MEAETVEEVVNEALGALGAGLEFGIGQAAGAREARRANRRRGGALTLHTTRAYMEGKKSWLRVELFPQTDIILFAGLFTDQPHSISGRNDVPKLIGERGDVPGATTLVGRGGGGRRVDLKRVGVYARFHLGGEAPGLEEVVLLHRL